MHVFPCTAPEGANGPTNVPEVSGPSSLPNTPLREEERAEEEDGRCEFVEQTGRCGQVGAQLCLGAAVDTLQVESEETTDYRAAVGANDATHPDAPCPCTCTEALLRVDEDVTSQSFFSLFVNVKTCFALVLARTVHGEPQVGLAMRRVESRKFAGWSWVSSR